MLLPWLGGATNYQDVQTEPADKGGKTTVKSSNAGVASSDSDDLVGMNKLDQILAEIDDFMTTGAKSKDRKAYDGARRLT